MVNLSECIVDIIIHEYGQRGLLERLSDPWFFQSLSCVLGYDWHSSGTTTVTCGALKMALDRQNMGLTVCGGKGRTSLKTPVEIREMAQVFGLSSYKTEGLVYASKMSAKTDNTLIQDSYQLYHHCFFFTEHGEWIVIQQGINEEKGNARRYHRKRPQIPLGTRPEEIHTGTRTGYTLPIETSRSPQHDSQGEPI